MGRLEVFRLVLAAWGLADPSLLVGACAQVPVKRVIPITNQRLVTVAHENDIQVHVWTIDEPTEMRDLLALNVDGLMTDRPEVLRDVLVESGKWDAGRISSI